MADKQFIHVKNLDKYHPNYKDRELKWAKIYFQMVQGDPDCELIDNEIDWARLVKLILLELQAKRPIPLDDNYLTKKGFNLRKRPMSLTLKMLQEFIVVITEPYQNRNVDKEIEEDKEIEKEVDKIGGVLQEWNSFAKENGLSEIKAILGKRRIHLSQRLKENTFDFPAILEGIKKSDFLLGKVNGKDWKVDFDFVIKSTTNYLKILEGNYINRNNGKPEQRKAIVLG